MKANSRAIDGAGVSPPFQIGSYNALARPVIAIHSGNAPPYF
jgi:hypothetical protein